MSLCNNINKLSPLFFPIAKWILDNAKKKYSINLIINETLREDDVQQAYWAQGRFDLITVNDLRKIAGLWKITETENKIITNVPHVSLIKGHGAGMAMDVVPNGKWNSSKEDWNKIGFVVDEARKEYEIYITTNKTQLVWGGTWKGLNDSPHIEMLKIS